MSAMADALHEQVLELLKARGEDPGDIAAYGRAQAELMEAPEVAHVAEPEVPAPKTSIKYHPQVHVVRNPNAEELTAALVRMQRSHQAALQVIVDLSQKLEESARAFEALRRKCQKHHSAVETPRP